MCLIKIGRKRRRLREKGRGEVEERERRGKKVGKRGEGNFQQSRG